MVCVSNDKGEEQYAKSPLEHRRREEVLPKINGAVPYKKTIVFEYDNNFYAYIPKGVKSQGQTLQSRNSSIGHYTEKWCNDLLSPIAKKLGLYAVNEVVCDELALSTNSPADLAFCTTDSKNQTANGIRLIFEVKMSIVNNYMYSSAHGIELIGDYKSHTGNPSLLRSDSMLKAIGKSLNIRVSSKAGNKIPIIVLGNSPITNHYLPKVDLLKESGVVQGFWSLYPNPCKDHYNQKSPKGGFCTINRISELNELCKKLINDNLIYFSSMLPIPKIGEIIRKASLEATNELRANKFLQLLREINQ